MPEPEGVTVYECQGCGKIHRRPGLFKIHSYGPYCSNHDPDGAGELYVAVAHETAPVVQQEGSDA